MTAISEIRLLAERRERELKSPTAGVCTRRSTADSALAIAAADSGD